MITGTKKVFYKKRTFTEKLNDTFGFIQQNWKVLLKYLCYIGLPFCLVQALSIGSMSSILMDSTRMAAMSQLDAIHLMVAYIGYFVPAIIGWLMVNALTFAFMTLYYQRSKGLEGIDRHDFMPLLKRYSGRIFIAGLIIALIWIAAIIVTVLLAVWTVVLSLIVAIPALFILMVCCVMVTPVYVYEDISIWEAVQKGFRYAWNTFGGMVGLGIVIVLISYCINLAMSLPFYIVLMGNGLLSAGTAVPSASQGIMMQLFTYVSGIISSFGYDISIVMTTIAVSYQYAHAADLLDDAGMEEAVEKFEELGENKEVDDFEEL